MRSLEEIGDGQDVQKRPPAVFYMQSREIKTSAFKVTGQEGQWRALPSRFGVDIESCVICSHARSGQIGQADKWKVACFQINRQKLAACAGGRGFDQVGAVWLPTISRGAGILYHAFLASLRDVLSKGDKSYPGIMNNSCGNSLRWRCIYFVR